MGLTADIIGVSLRWLYLDGRPRPYTGLARAAYHVEQACFFAWLAAIAGAALVVLARRHWWPAVAAWAAVVIAHSAAYPWLRGERLWWAARAEQTALIVLLGVLIARWSRRNDWPTVHHFAIGGLCIVELVILLAVFTTDPNKSWLIAQVLYLFLFLALAIAQWRWQWKASDYI